MTLSRAARALVVAATLFTVGVPRSEAQVVGRFEGRSVTDGGYFVNARAGEPTVRVYIWGGVRNPGVYELGPGFDLSGALSLAGLPTRSGGGAGDLDVYVRVYRPGGGEAVYVASLEQFALRPGDHPGLREGDVITVGPEPSARVSVWGAVHTPGLYEVGPDFGPQAVLSLAGGPLLPTLQEGVSREVTVRYVRRDRVLYEGPLEEFTRASPSLPSPIDGDVVEVAVRERRRFSFRDALTVAGTVAGIITGIVLVVSQLGAGE